jgi:hypothetical protein
LTFQRVQPKLPHVVRHLHDPFDPPALALGTKYMNC